MERLLVEHARHADRERVSLQFVALGSRGPVAEEIEACGWPVTTLDTRGGLRPSTVFRLARLFREQRVDVVQTHNTKPLLYAGPAARVSGVRGVIHTRHGQRHGASRRQDLLFRLAGRCADRMVCVSQDSARLCQLEGFGSERVQVIRNGIDTRRFAFHGPALNGPAIFVGRLSPEKDLPTLLRAVAIIITRRSDFRLLIAGTGPQAAELAALSRLLCLDDHVRFIGEARDVPALLRGGSLFVLPSLTEGVPLTVLEAMACGLPVIATRVGGTAEAVDDARTGLLVPPARPDLLAAAMLRVLNGPAAAQAMGMAGRARVEASFDVRLMVHRYQSLYEELTAKRFAVAA